MSVVKYRSESGETVMHEIRCRTQPVVMSALSDLVAKRFGMTPRDARKVILDNLANSLVVEELFDAIEFDLTGDVQ